MKTDIELMNYTIEAGVKKANKSIKDMFLAGILAGIFIALGTIGYLVVTGKASPEEHAFAIFAGGIIFSVGLILVLFLGGSLFTGNCLITIAALNKKTTFKKMSINWAVIWVGNLVGSLIMVYICFGSKLLEKKHVVEGLINWTEFKMTHTFAEAVLLGVLCNIIVVLIVLLAYAAKDATGKALVAIVGIIVFIASGYEHIVANMFILPLGLLHGADHSVLDMIVNNFIPVTIGNIIGGGLIVPVIYHMIYKSKVN